MNYAEILKPIFRTYSSNSIIITDHAYEQALFRGISAEEIKQNILNPERLTFANRQEAEKPDEEKYDCYFAYTKT